jgi:prefoldin subunit 5
MNSKRMDIDDALEFVRQECEQIEVYSTLKDYIEDLEQEIEGLNIEIEAIEAVPRSHRAREEDWR